MSRWLRKEGRRREEQQMEGMEWALSRTGVIFVATLNTAPSISNPSLALPAAPLQGRYPLSFHLVLAESH